MERRVYGLPSKTSGILSIPVGKALLQIEFTKGCTDRKNYRPATYATNDPTFQKMIENSDLFKKGSIILWRVYDLGGDEPEEETNVAPAKPVAKVGDDGVEVYDEVYTLKEAVIILKSKGVPATRLRNKESVKVAATEAGVSFPNFA